MAERLEASPMRWDQNEEENHLGTMSEVQWEVMSEAKTLAREENPIKLYVSLNLKGSPWSLRIRENKMAPVMNRVAERPEIR